jgi:hypothetical protein
MTDLTEDERAVWDAVFAAAWMHTPSLGWSPPKLLERARYAIAQADQAVMGLRVAKEAG